MRKLIRKQSKRKQNKTKTAILLRCTEEEGAAIREAAREEKRTISGFILNAILNRPEAHDGPLRQPLRVASGCIPSLPHDES